MCVVEIVGLEKCRWKAGKEKNKKRKIKKILDSPLSQ
jgi:hypothetical protein